MERKAFRPKKRFGQCFLYDPAIAGKILACVDLKPGQPVIELGAGKGILTRPLAERGGRLMALEITHGCICRIRKYESIYLKERIVSKEPTTY